MRLTLTRLARVSEVICFKARTVVCDALATLAETICDISATITQRVCDATATIAQTICDATETVTQTICDATETVTQTICDATETVTQTICDAFDSIPFIGDLICAASHVVSSVVCTASHIVSTVVCTASHIVSSIICIASHIVAVVVCVLSHVVSSVVCLLSHIVTTVICIVWQIIVGIVCAIVNGIIKVILCFIVKTFSILRRRREIRPAVKHVFVLMLENRAFDHMLGFSGIQGTDAVTGLPTTVDGLVGNPHSNVDPGNGAVIAAAPPADFKIPEADKDPGHEFDNTVTALCGPGKVYPDPGTGGYPPITNSGFVANYRDVGSAHPEKIMNCYSHAKPDQLPILRTLAAEFAVCDRWFSSMPGPTWPNRFFVHAASSGGLDDSPSGFQSALSLVDGYGFENGTIYDSLDWACLDWEIFEGDELPQVFSINGMSLNAARGKFTDFEDFVDRLSQRGYSPCYIFIEPNYGNVLPVITSGDFTCGNSQHPLDDVTRGERLIKQVYETIRNSPHWESSLLIITYDEHGGFYDHVAPPPAVAPGDAISDPANDHHHFDFQQLGARVPAVVISPLIPRNTIDHTRYDHSSVLATVERLFGLSPLTNRDAAANDVLHLLSLASPRSDAPTTLPEPAQSGFHCDDDPAQAAARAGGAG